MGESIYDAVDWLTSRPGEMREPHGDGLTVDLKMKNIMHCDLIWMSLTSQLIQRGLIVRVHTPSSLKSVSSYKAHRHTAVRLSF